MDFEKNFPREKDGKRVAPKKEIQFKPITEGLGFHPFSDGLPYASQNTTPVKKPSPPSMPMGTGAVAAGRPQFLNPSFTPPSVPSTKVPGHYTKAPNPYAVHLPLTQSPLTPQSLQTPISSPQWSTPVFRIGYSLERAFGFLIDTAFNLSLAATVLSFALIKTDIELLQSVSSSSLILSGVFVYLCNWAAIAGQEVAFGTSLGKRVFGLSIPGTGSDAFIRAVAFIPSSLFFGLGIFAGLFDSQKRCWHDRFARVQPEWNA
jgi:hypothetical protein